MHGAAVVQPLEQRGHGQGRADGACQGTDASHRTGCRAGADEAGGGRQPAAHAATGNHARACAQACAKRTERAAKRAQARQGAGARGGRAGGPRQAQTGSDGPGHWVDHGADDGAQHQGFEHVGHGVAQGFGKAFAALEAAHQCVGEVLLDLVADAVEFLVDHFSGGAGFGFVARSLHRADGRVAVGLAGQGGVDAGNLFFGFQLDLVLLQGNATLHV